MRRIKCFLWIALGRQKKKDRNGPLQCCITLLRRIKYRNTQNDTIKSHFMCVLSMRNSFGSFVRLLVTTGSFFLLLFLSNRCSNRHTYTQNTINRERYAIWCGILMLLINQKIGLQTTTTTKWPTFFKWIF